MTTETKSIVEKALATATRSVITQKRSLYVAAQTFRRHGVIFNDSHLNSAIESHELAVQRMEQIQSEVHAEPTSHY